MGVDTRAILRKGVTIEQIEKAMSEKYTDVEVIGTRMPDFMYVTFKDGDNQRSLAVSFANTCERDNGIPGVWVSLGASGNSVQIVMFLCETFGGYLDENNCDDEGFYPVNLHLYLQGSEFTELDKFRHKVILQIGYDKLNTVMGLLDEYLEISGIGNQKTIGGADEIKLQPVVGSSGCQYSVVENKLEILYKNQEKLLQAILSRQPAQSL